MLFWLIVFGAIYAVYRMTRKSGSILAALLLPLVAVAVCGLAGIVLAAANDADPFIPFVTGIGNALVFGYPAAILALILNRRENRIGKSYLAGPSDPHQRYLWANRLPPYGPDET